MKQRVKKLNTKHNIYHPFEQQQFSGTQLQSQLHQIQTEEPKESFAWKVLKEIQKGLGNFVRYVFNKPVIVGQIQVYHQPYGPVKYLNEEQALPLKRKVPQGIIQEPTENNYSIIDKEQNSKMLSSQQSKKRKLESKQNSPQKPHKQLAQQTPEWPTKFDLGKIKHKRVKSPSVREIAQKIKQRNEQQGARQIQKIYNTQPNQKPNVSLQVSLKDTISVDKLPKQMVSACVQTDNQKQVEIQVTATSPVDYHQQLKLEAAKQEDLNIKGKLEQQIPFKPKDNKLLNKNQNQEQSKIIQPQVQQPLNQTPANQNQVNQSIQMQKQQTLLQQIKPTENFQITPQFGKNEEMQSSIQAQEKKEKEKASPAQIQVSTQPVVSQNFLFPAQVVEIPFESEGFYPDSEENNDNSSEQDEEDDQNQLKQNKPQETKLFLTQTSQAPATQGKTNPLFGVSTKNLFSGQTNVVFGQSNQGLNLSKEANNNQKQSQTSQENVQPQTNLNLFPAAQDQKEVKNEQLQKSLQIPFGQTQLQQTSQKNEQPTTQAPVSLEQKTEVSTQKQENPEPLKQALILSNTNASSSINPFTNQIPSSNTNTLNNPNANPTANQTNSSLTNQSNNNPVIPTSNPISNPTSNPFITLQSQQLQDKSGNPFLATENQAIAPAFRFGQQTSTVQDNRVVKQLNTLEDNKIDRPQTPAEVSMTPNNQIFNQNFNAPMPLNQQQGFNQNLNPFQVINQKQQNAQQNEINPQIPFQSGPQQTFGQSLGPKYGVNLTQPLNITNQENPLKQQTIQFPFSQNQQLPFQPPLSNNFQTNSSLSTQQNTVQNANPFEIQQNKALNMQQQSGFGMNFGQQQNVQPQAFTSNPFGQNQLPGLQSNQQQSSLGMQNMRQTGQIAIQQQPFFVGNAGNFQVIEDDNKQDGQRMIHKARRPAKK